MAKQPHQFVPGWMDYETAAFYTCFSERTIRSLIQRGLLPTTSIEGGHPRIKREDLDALMEAHKRKGLLKLAEEIISETQRG